MDYSEVLNTINEDYTKGTSRWINNVIKEFRKGIIKFDRDSLGLSLLLDEIIIYRRQASKKERNAVDKKMRGVISKIESLADEIHDSLELDRIYNAFKELGLIQSKKKVKDSNQINRFLKFIIFNSKDINTIKRIIVDYPDIINSISEDGIGLISKITKKFLFNLSNFMVDKNIKHRNNLLFYSEVLKMLLLSEDSKYEYTEELENEALEVLSDFLRENDGYYGNSEFTFWITDLLDTITKRAIIKTETALERSTDIHREFPGNVMFVVKNGLFTKYEEELEKRDHNDEHIITIDCVGARVLDDGLSAKRLDNGHYLLGVHIADPLGYVGFHSPLIQEAYKRTSTIYTSSGKPIHIFPDEFYAKVGLSPNSNNLAISYYLEIDELGNIYLDHFVIKKEVINVRDRFTFNKGLDEIVASSFDPRIEDTVENLYKISEILKKKLPIAPKDDLLTPGERESSELVQYSMFALNMTMANYAARHKIPFLFIANGQKAEYFDQLQEINPLQLPDRDTKCLYTQLCHNRGKSFYTTDSKQLHHSLGGIPYTRVTSPLLLFGDTLASIALHAFYFGEVEPEDLQKVEEDMFKMAKYMNHKVKSIGFYERGWSKLNED